MHLTNLLVQVESWNHSKCSLMILLIRFLMYSSTVSTLEICGPPMAADGDPLTTYQSQPPMAPPLFSAQPQPSETQSSRLALRQLVGSPNDAWGSPLAPPATPIFFPLGLDVAAAWTGLMNQLLLCISVSFWFLFCFLCLLLDWPSTHIMLVESSSPCLRYVCIHMVVQKKHKETTLSNHLAAHNPKFLWFCMACENWYCALEHPCQMQEGLKALGIYPEVRDTFGNSSTSPFSWLANRSCSCDEKHQPYNRQTEAATAISRQDNKHDL